ncbi:unnamed protein product [Triticum turgidum subsp. durum]|uniref:RBR-type E3 ubiquitin transferase n=1 Tax=Triticum turgidum subsp. durum TaxID=4567 RepID=A0A9R0TW03_TRITD|nr:unnamed protein product [Triticum turgidum subsp. durum]
MALTSDNEEEYYSSPEEGGDDDDRLSFRTASNESDNDAGAGDDADDDCLYGDSDGDDDGMYDEYEGDEEEGLEEVDEEGEVLDEMRFTATQYAVLTMDEVRARQEEHTARVADLIALPPGFLVRSYVEESKRIRWCPAPGCDRAVEFDGEKCTVQLDAWCACGHGFCLACGEEAHRPVACDTVREWLETNRSDSNTAQWVLANTKHCPECRRPIEKNQGCMHMTCSPPCKHQFCWLCLGPWDKHDGGNYNCNTYNTARAEGKYTEEELRRAQAKASVDRYLHYYERWGAHERSRQKALEDTAALGKDGAQREAVAAAFGVVETELDFLEEAYRQVAECRRMLRWTYAFGYYLDDPAKRDLFEDLQSQADKSLERLHECAEKDRAKLVAEAAGEHGAVADKYLEFRPRLSSLTTVARNHFENMARAFRDGLAEVEVDPAVAARRAAAAPPPPPLDDDDDEDFFEELRM